MIFKQFLEDLGKESLSKKVDKLLNKATLAQVKQLITVMDLCTDWQISPHPLTEAQFDPEMVRVDYY